MIKKTKIDIKINIDTFSIRKKSCFKILNQMLNLRTQSYLNINEK